MISTGSIWYWHDGKLNRTEVRWEFKGVSRSPHALAIKTGNPYASHRDTTDNLFDCTTTWEKDFIICEKSFVCNTCFTHKIELPDSPTACSFEFVLLYNFPIAQKAKPLEQKRYAQQFPVSLFFIANFTLFVKRSLLLWTKSSSTVSFPVEDGILLYFTRSLKSWKTLQNLRLDEPLKSNKSEEAT